MDDQPFFKTIAAEHLARLKPAQATDTLIAVARKDSLQVRLGSITALGQIAAAHDDKAPVIAGAMLELLSDAQALVRLEAVDALGLFPGKVGTDRQAILTALRKCAEDSSPIVKNAARRVLRRAFRVAL